MASDAKEIDAGVATHISDCYDEFIGDHSDLKIDDLTENYRNNMYDRIQSGICSGHIQRTLG